MRTISTVIEPSGPGAIRRIGIVAHHALDRRGLHQRDAFGETHSVDLVQPDFEALTQSFGVPVKATEPPGLREALDWAFATEGPAVVVLRATVAAHQPTP